MYVELAQLPTEAIQEFKKLYESEFGEKLTDNEAKNKANLIYQIIGCIHQPIPTPTMPKNQS